MNAASEYLLMSYELEFKESALKEWHKLDKGIRELFKKRLAERLLVPSVESARLSAMPDCYKKKCVMSGTAWFTKSKTPR